MAGIYLHIPFCKQACHYCDFHFSTSLNHKVALLSALKKEIQLQKVYLEKEIIETVYFGGGTPSLLSYDDLMILMDELQKNYSIEQNVEITLEANPDDISIKKIDELKKASINRLSIGIQSFCDDELKWMNRAHCSSQATESIKIAIGEGISNISIDLIYGTPSLTNERWKKNIEQAITHNVSHISAYCITVEPKTALASFIKKGKTKSISEEKCIEHFQILTDIMFKNNFQHYEISNFCMEGFMSKHNTNYWLRKKYLGIGPSAHSYDEKSRQWNISNNLKYIQSIEKNEIPFEKEILSTTDRFNEYIMTSLRTMWGIDLDYLHANFEEELVQNFKNKIPSFTFDGSLTIKEKKILLTEKGKLLADKITSELFVTNNRHK